MATRVFRGDAKKVAQVDTLTPANVEIGDIFKATINGKTVSFTATAATVANVTAGLTTAWNAETEPEFEEITASDSTTHVTLTGDTAGKPFTVTTSTTNGGAADTQTLTQATTTAATGPNHWNQAANWSGDTVPVSADDVYINDGSVDILYGLDQSAVTLTSLTIGQGYTGKIGLAKVNTANSSKPYTEYRDDYLKISATTLTLGIGDGSGSGRIKINLGTAQTTAVIRNSGQAAETGIPSILLLGTHASNAISVFRGSVGIAFFPGEVSTVATLRVGYTTNQAGDSAVKLGDGCTLTDIDISGGVTLIQDNTTTIDLTGGELTIVGAATAANIDLASGIVYYESTGTLTTVIVYGGAVLDFSRDMRPRTVTNAELHAGGSIRDPFKTVTWTNGVDLVRAELPKPGASGASVRELDLGRHVTITPSAV